MKNGAPGAGRHKTKSQRVGHPEMVQPGKDAPPAVSVMMIDSGGWLGTGQRPHPESGTQRRFSELRCSHPPLWFRFIAEVIVRRMRTIPALFANRIADVLRRVDVEPAVRGFYLS